MHTAQGDVVDHTSKPFDKNPMIAIEVRLLYDRLNQMKPDETVPYQELEDLIGRSVRGGKDAYVSLKKATKRLQQDHNMVFRPEQGRWLRRLTDQEILLLPRKHRQHIYHTVSKASRELSCVEFEKLDQEQKRKHNAEMAAFGALGLFAKQSDMKRIEQASGSAEPLPVGKVLALFARHDTP